jgi:8-oxo-dGTP pyrophosphatase MutT (NUDIX family)
MNYIDKLGWLKIENRKVLSARSKGTDLYYIPGGKREAGETDEQALCREIKEELSVQLIPDSLKFLERFEAQAHGKPEGIMVRMTLYSGDHNGEIRANAEIDEVTWLNTADKAKCSAVYVIIMDWLKQKNLID